ncbi:MAG: hypothetical protein ABI404_03605 [Bradyrhizobium sp.]
MGVDTIEFGGEADQKCEQFEFNRSNLFVITVARLRTGTNLSTGGAAHAWLSGGIQNQT